MSEVDERLLTLFGQRDEAALSELQNTCGHTAVRIACDILHDRQDAEECLNDALLRLWNSIPPACPTSVRAYFLRTVRNLSLNRYSARLAEKRDGNADLGVALEELADCLPDLAEEDRRSGADEALRNCLIEFLRTEDETSRALFMGRYWNEMPVEALAEAWGLSRFAVSRRLRGTRERLSRYLCERGYKYDE